MVTMNPSIKRGSAELAVLAVLEQQPLHGYEIARRIEQESDGALRFTLASLYPCSTAWRSGGGRRPRGRPRPRASVVAATD